jgi:putative nucleotidyltransferase with HDIG domain
MPQRARYFFTAVIAAAAVAAACVLPGTDWANVPRAPFLVLLLLQVLLNLTIRLPETQESPAGPAMVSVLLASIVLLPPGAAALTGAVASSCMVLRRADPLRVAFACAVAFLAAIAAGEVYHAAHGHTAVTGADFPGALVPIGLGVLVLSAVPAAIIETFLVQVGNRTRRAAIRDFGFRMVPRNIAYALVGLLTAVLWSVSYDALAALVLLGPVIVTRWATMQYEEQRTAHDAIIRTLVQAVEIKDLYTRGHSERVARISAMIADELRLPPERVEVLRYAATLHDVGKLGVPTRLLRKTERLDDEEFEEIRLHPSRGVEVVRDIAFLDEAYSAILHHHERMDGLGYPSGLRGMRIPPFARIIAVADAFDSMTSTRSYRGARGSDEALNELRANVGTQFDPAIVDAIAAALARAELAGRPWRGDGTAYEAGRGGQPELAELPPGAVVAQFDHDDPAYQLLTADAEGADKPQTDDYASDESDGYLSGDDDGLSGDDARVGTDGGLGDGAADDGPSGDGAGAGDGAERLSAEPGELSPGESGSPGAPGDRPEAPSLRLAAFRSALRLPAQTMRVPKLGHGADAPTPNAPTPNAPTNTSPETEGR